MSTLYSRRISLNPFESTWMKPGAKKPELLPSITTKTSLESNRSRRLGAASRNDDSIIELFDDGGSSTPLVPKKVAQKRPPQTAIPQINLADDDDDDEDANRAEQTQAVAKVSSYQAFNKSNRPITEFEKKLNEKLNRNTTFLESL